MSTMHRIGFFALLFLIACSAEGPEIVLEGSGSGASVERGDRLIALVKGSTAKKSEVIVAGISVPVQVLSSNAISFVIPEQSPSGSQKLYIRMGTSKAEFTLTIVERPSANVKLLIIVKPGVVRDALAAELAKLGFSLEGSLSALGAITGPCSGQLAKVKIGHYEVKKAEKDLEALGDDYLLEPWGRAEDLSPLIDPESDYGVDSLPYSEAIGVTTAHNRGYGGAGITIAVLDTGVNEHTDLAGRVLDGRSFVGEADKGKRDIYSEGDAKLHGTPIALLAAGKTSGVAPKAEILPVRVCDAKGHCPSASVIEGLCFALAHGAKTDRLDRMVLNLSWGSNQPSDIVKNILGYAGSQGVLTATAVGNDYKTDKNAINYPANHVVDGLLSVAALSQEGDRWLPTDYSNRGYHVAISAPGDSLLLPTGRYSGTSFATALVSGSLALYRESYNLEQDTPLDIEHALKRDATPLAGERREAVGTGMVNLRRLIDNNNVLEPMADRDNIPYDMISGIDATAWPYPDLLQGVHEYFFVSGLTYAYLKFDLSDIDKPIRSAKLRVYRDASPDADCEMHVYEVQNDNWLESSLDSLPDRGPEIASVITSPKRYMQIDISNYARSQQEDGNLSLALNCGHRNWVVIHSREGQERPKLILDLEG